MNLEDFDQIIVESFAYQLKQDYFEAKRIEFDCSILDFAGGLNESFQRFNLGIIQSPYLHIKPTTPDENSSIFVNQQDEKTTMYKSLMERIEELPFPVETIIDRPIENEFLFSAEITLKLLSIVQPEIETYLLSAYKSLDPGIVIPDFILNGSILKSKDNQSNKRMKLSLKQVALKYAWEEKTITKENRDDIAKMYGHNSGNKLHQNYSNVMKKTSRIADPDGTTKLLQNKIVLFESVIEILSEEYKKNAIEELKILQTILEKVHLKKL